jgi:hypothetical protein
LLNRKSLLKILQHPLENHNGRSDDAAAAAATAPENPTHCPAAHQQFILQTMEKVLLFTNDPYYLLIIILNCTGNVIQVRHINKRGEAESCKQHKFKVTTNYFYIPLGAVQILYISTGWKTISDPTR